MCVCIYNRYSLVVYVLSDKFPVPDNHRFPIESYAPTHPPTKVEQESKTKALYRLRRKSDGKTLREKKGDDDWELFGVEP